MMTKQIDQAYQNATGNWDTADWTHEFQPVSGFEPEDEPEEKFRRFGAEDCGPIYCEGNRGDICRTCRNAERDARAAEEAALRAINWAESGDLHLALKAATEAASLENGWGDDPTWRPLMLAVQAALDAEEAAEYA